MNYIKYHRDFNTLKLYTLKSLLSKSRFYFFSRPLAGKSSAIYWDITLLACILQLSFSKFLDFFKFNLLDKVLSLIRLKIRPLCFPKKLLWLDKKIKEIVFTKAKSFEVVFKITVSLELTLTSKRWSVISNIWNTYFDTETRQWNFVDFISSCSMMFT